MFFHMSLLEEKTTRKERVDEKMTELDFEAGNSKDYEVEAIQDSAIHAKESENHPLGLYYLITWKGYPEEENIWKLVLAVQYLRKLIHSFHKNHSKRPIITFPPVNSALPMARPTIKSTRPTKQKQGQLASSNNKWAKKIEPFACSLT